MHHQCFTCKVVLAFLNNYYKEYKIHNMRNTLSVIDTKRRGNLHVLLIGMSYYNTPFRSVYVNTNYRVIKGQLTLESSIMLLNNVL